jgi:hypothetical protein
LEIGDCAEAIGSGDDLATAAMQVTESEARVFVVDDAFAQEAEKE